MPAALHPMARALLPADATAGWVLDHFGELAELDELAWRHTRRPPQAAADLLDLPVRLGPDGETALYRLSLGAWLWLEHCASSWWQASEPNLYNAAHAWAMAHGRTPEALRDAAEEQRARWLVLTWARGLRCSEAALMAAARGLMPEGDPLAHYYAAAPQDPREDPGWGKVLDAMSRETGRPAEHWLWEVSRERFLSAVSEWNDQAEATAEAMRAKGDPRDPDSYRSRTAWAFRNAQVAAMQRWKAEAAQ